MRLASATTYLLKDEPAYLLLETWREVPMEGKQRVQKIWVARGDRLAVHESMLGPEANYPGANPFQVLSGIGDDPPMFWAYSVGEIQDIADMLRSPDGARSPEGDQPRHTAEEFHSLWFDNLEEKMDLAARRSTFGRYQVRQRD